MYTSARAAFLLLAIMPVTAQQASSRPVIVSPTTPTDSLGETVYEVQGESQKDVPVVPGVSVPPVAITTPKPKFPKTFKNKKTTEVAVDGVVTQNGDFIDAKAAGSVDPDFAALALETVALYKFKPATLDGKPVAARIRIVIKFRIF